MATLNFAHREITAKIVYFGAPSAGSSTNVRTLYEILPVKEKGGLHQFGDEKEKTWYFEYVPAGGKNIKGMSLRFHVYGMPGGIVRAEHRKEILRGTDAVVFVADARKEREANNIESLLDLEGLLKEDNLEMAQIPMVIQVNRTDDVYAREAERVVYELNPYGFPVIEAVARDSKGVLEAHEQVTTVTVNRIRENLAGKEATISLTAVHNADRESDQQIIAQHIHAIHQAQRARIQELANKGAWADLPPAGEIELTYQPADFAGTRPLQVIGARIAGEEVKVDLIMEQESTGTPRRLQITLLNQPIESPTLGRVNTASSVTPPERITPSPLDTLPDIIELSTPAPDKSDFPPLWYGVAGLASGVVIGLLIGVLSFL
jgi:signal recognition particle receptor subunit beta